MPCDFNPGRDAHPLHLLILVALSRPGCEQIVPMLFLIAVRRHVGQLALLIYMQRHRSRHVLLACGSLDRVSIDGLPLDSIREPGGREPDHFSQIALQLTLVQKWTMRIPHGDERQELDDHAAMASREPIRGRDPGEGKRPHRAAPEERRRLRREVLFRDQRHPLLTWLLSHNPLLSETDRLHGTAVGEQRDDDDDQLAGLASPLKHGSSPLTKRLFADLAAIALPFAIMDDDVALSFFGLLRNTSDWGKIASVTEALNEPSVSDLCASAEQEISKELRDRLPTPGWRNSFGKHLLRGKHRRRCCVITIARSDRLRHVHFSST